jgi:hypothetical protein
MSKICEQFYLDTMSSKLERVANDSFQLAFHFPLNHHPKNHNQHLGVHEAYHLLALGSLLFLKSCLVN